MGFLFVCEGQCAEMGFRYYLLRKRSLIVILGVNAYLTIPKKINLSTDFADFADFFVK